MPTLAIDRASGRVTCGKGVVHPGSSPAELPPDVQWMSPGTPADDAGWTTGRVRTAGMQVDIQLRFQLSRLDRVVMVLTPPHHLGLSGDAFYLSVDERWNFHRRWLRRQLGQDLVFDWGSAGVGRDKSEEVFIWLDFSRQAEGD